MAEAQDADVQEVMERIQDNIRRRRGVEPGPTSEPLATFDLGQGASDFSHQQALGDLRKVSLASHRSLLGPLIIAIKKTLLKLLTPILEQQAAYNAASTGATAGIATGMQTLERRQAHALRAATERLERSQRQAMLDLRGYLSEEIARVRTDLDPAERDSQHRQEMSDLRQETSDLRQEVAAQSRAIESANATLATLRARATETERKWRRVVHALRPDRPADGPPHEKPMLAPAEIEPEFDYAGFEERFRGSEEDIKERQRIYVPCFAGAENVLDLGCGRGEFLELLREQGISGRGIDLDLDMVLLCQDKKLDVVRDDVFAHLGALADDAVGGIFAAQLIEHLPPRRLVDLVKLCHRKLAPGGVLVLETPNPGCLMVFADSFYRDLSHIQPIHPDTLKFLFEATGFHGVEARFSAPVDPARRIPPLETPGADFERLNQGIERLNALLFGFQDYAAIGRKIG